MGEFGTGRLHLDPACLFFSILKLVSFKKLNEAGWDEIILKHVLFTFDFFLFFIYICFYFYYIKINIFHKK